MTEIAQYTVGYVPSGDGFGSKLAGMINAPSNSAGKTAGGFFGKSFGAALAGLGVGAGIAKILGDSISEARESQKVTAQTGAVIKSTGGAANLTADQFGNLATAISNKTGIDDEQIQAGENMLATFTNVRNEVGKGNDIFNQATATSTDLAKATGVSQVKANVMLGKALNNPVKGISALQRVGVTFTEQQKKQIATMQKSGDTAGAQKVILGELNKEFGGSAEASSTAGEKFQTAFKNLEEQLGTALLPTLDNILSFFTTTLIPAISNGLTSIGPTVSAVVGFFKQWGPVLLPIVGIVLGVIGAIKVWTAVQAALNVVMSLNPIGLVVIAIGALVVGLIYAYKHSETFRNVVNAVFSVVKGQVVGAITVIKVVIHSLVIAFNATKNAIVSFVSAAISRFNAIRAGISNAMSAAKSAVSNAFNAIVSAVASKIASVVTKVQSLKTKIVGAFKSANSLLLSVGKNIIDGLVNGIANNASAVVNKLKDVVKSAIDAAKNALGIHSPSRVFFEIGGYTTQGLINGLDSQAVGKAAQGLSNAMRSNFDGELASGSGRGSRGALVTSSGASTQPYVIHLHQDGLISTVDSRVDRDGKFNTYTGKMYNG